MQKNSISSLMPVSQNCLFSTCKCCSKQNVWLNPPFEINGGTFEYVNKWPHLDHIISSNLNDEAENMQHHNIIAGQIIIISVMER